jgi:cell division protein FtsN
MPTNKLLTYIMFAVLFGLLAVAGYKACEMKQQETLQAQEQAELDQALRDLGYPMEDTTKTTVYTGGDVDYNTPAAGAASAAKNPYDQPATASGSQQAAYIPPNEYDQPAAPANTAPKTTTTNTVTKSTAGRIVDYDNEVESADGRYRVVAGSFTIKDNARRQMETLIRMGYSDSEVGLYNRGKYAVVIVKRTNSLNEANQILDKLEDKGIDAAVIDRRRK